MFYDGRSVNDWTRTDGLSTGRTNTGCCVEVATGKRVKCTFKLNVFVFVLVLFCLSGQSLVFPTVLNVETLDGLQWGP